MKDARPGYARITRTDTPKTVEAKMREAFSPVRAAREGIARSNPAHKWRDPRSGRFVSKS